MNCLCGHPLPETGDFTCPKCGTPWRVRLSPPVTITESDLAGPDTPIYTRADMMNIRLGGFRVTFMPGDPEKLQAHEMVASCLISRGGDPELIHGTHYFPSADPIPSANELRLARTFAIDALMAEIRKYLF